MKIDEEVNITVTDLYSNEIISLKGKGDAGMNKVVWNIRKKQKNRVRVSISNQRAIIGELVPPGEYIVIIEIGDKKMTRKAVICKMPGN